MAYEKQTWVTGETITASKLNHMEDGIASGASYDLVLTETFAENQNPAMTGTGLSFEELMQKIDNGDVVLVKYIQHNTQYGQHYACIGIHNTHEHDSHNNTDTLTVIGAPLGSQLLDVIRYYDDGESVSLTICGYTIYTFTYNSTTKEYTFTLDYYVD